MIISCVTSALRRLFSRTELPPELTLQPPPSVRLSVGSPLCVPIQVRGTEPFQFVWHRNFEPLNGQRTAVLCIRSLRCEDAGIYTCIVMNPYGFTTTLPFQLTVEKLRYERRVLHPITLGRPIYTGKRGISNVRGSFVYPPRELKENVDFTFDAAMGRITIPSSGCVADALQQAEDPSEVALLFTLDYESEVPC